MFFSLRKEKNEKKPQASGLTVCAAGSGSVAAMKDGVHAHFGRVIRQPPPLSQASRRRALTRRAPCACGRRLPSGNHFPHGGWWPVRASRAWMPSFIAAIESLPAARTVKPEACSSFDAFLSVKKSMRFPFPKRKRTARNPVPPFPYLISFAMS